MFTGLDIQIDFAMYEDEKETKRKAKLLKKKGGKPLGGKLFKMSQNQPKPEVVKPKQDHKLKDDDDKNYFSFSTKPGVGRDGDAKEDGDAQQKADVANASAQKVPRVRRIVGAQMLNQNGESVPMNILNSSNPADL